MSADRKLRLLPPGDADAATTVAGAWLHASTAPTVALALLDRAWSRDTGPDASRAEAAALALCLTDATYRDFRRFAERAGHLVGALDGAAMATPDRRIVIDGGIAVGALHGTAALRERVPPFDAFVDVLRRCSDGDADRVLAGSAAMMAYLDASSRMAEAARLEVEAARFEAQASPWWRGHWRSICGQHALFAHRRDDAARHLAAAAEIARAHSLRELAVVVAVMSARLALVGGDVAGARALLAGCEPVDDATDPMWRAILLQQASLALLIDEHYAEALSVAHRAVAFAELADAPDDEGAQMRVLEGYCLVAAGDGAAAAASFRAALDRVAPVQREQLRVLARFADVMAMPMGAARRAELAAAFSACRALRYTAVYWPVPRALARLAAEALAAGIEVDHVRDLVRLRRLDPPRAAPRAWPWNAAISTLGRFAVEVGGRAPRSLRGKPFDLLLLLVAVGGRQVAVDPLIAALWPGEGRVGADAALHVTLHRLRRALGGAGAVVLSDRLLSLDAASIWVDLWALDDAIEAMATAGPGELPAAVDALQELYRGPLLPTVDDPRVAGARDRLRRRVDAALAGACLRMERDAVRAVAMRAVAADPDLALTAASAEL